MEREPNPSVVFTDVAEVEIQDRPIPRPAAGEVLIRTSKSLISTGTETTVLSGDFPKDSAWARYAQGFPIQPGYCNVGEVVEVAAKGDEDLLGKKVCSYGVHARYVAMARDEVKVIDRPVRDEHAAFATMFSITANGVRKSGIQFGESAVVFGLGLLGQIAVRLLDLAGARPIVAADISEWRLELLPKGPHVHPVNPRSQDIDDVVPGLCRGRKADVVFEVTGNQNAIPGELAALRDGGTFVVLSSPRGKVEFDFHDLCNAPSFTLLGVHSKSHPKVEEYDNPWTIRRHWELFFDLLAGEVLDLDPLISHRASYADAPSLYHMLLNSRDKAMGVVLDWR